MNKLNQYKDTIALVVSYLILLGATSYYDFPILRNVLIGIFVLVIGGEFASIKLSGETISKNFGEHATKIKVIIIALMWLFMGCLSWHLLS
jgi:hypothetical protein